MKANENLKNLRKEKKLSQKELSEILKISQSVICDYENNKVDPTTNVLIKYADFFGVSTDYLLGRENDEGNIITVSPGLTDEEQRLIDYYRALPPELRSGVMTYTRTFYELDNKANTHKSKIEV